MLKNASSTTVWETSLPLPLLSRGKVRDIYEVDADKLLIVTTDRLSAFDVVLPSPVPDKGKVLNQVSLFWFKKFQALVPNHILASEVGEMGFEKSFVKEHGKTLQGRSILVYRAQPLPIECVARGFITGSGWKDYLKTGKVCGHPLPVGLKQCQELKEPLFTPATKATVGHDMNIDFAEVVKLVGKQTADKVRNLTLTLYKRGVQFAKTRGILIADTKFEFGMYKGKIMLIDEALTPDSSRFWPQKTYRVGQDQPSLDKQIVRNYLLESGWNQRAPGPSLPQDIMDRTSKAYKDVFKQLTGKKLKK